MSIFKGFWVLLYFAGLGGQPSLPVNVFPVGDTAFHMKKALYNGQPVSYVAFAASDKDVANRLNYKATAYNFTYPWAETEYAPKLACTLDSSALGDVYLVRCAQTVIFSTDPTQPDYTPLWRVHNLEFDRGKVPVPVNSIAQIQSLISTGDLVYVEPISVLDATIVVDSQGNVIKQAKCIKNNIRCQFIVLPTIPVYFTPTDYYNPHGEVRWMANTDVSDQSLATQLGANYAPGLLGVGSGCCNNVFAFTNPAATAQLPVVDEAPYCCYLGVQPASVPVKYYATAPVNQRYTPVKCWTLLDQVVADPPSGPTNTYKSYNTILSFLGNQLEIVPSSPVVTNSPIVCEGISVN